MNPFRLRINRELQACNDFGNLVLYSSSYPNNFLSGTAVVPQQPLCNGGIVGSNPAYSTELAKTREGDSCEKRYYDGRN